MANVKLFDAEGLRFYDEGIKKRLSKKANISDIPTNVSQLNNDSGYITISDIPEGAAASTTVPKMDGIASTGTETAFARGDHIHPTDTSRLSTTGDGSQVTVSFNVASERTAVDSGDTLAIAVGKIAKHLVDLGLMAYKDGITSDDLDASIKASLAKADSALQSYTETDPTVPEWAKEATKPIYTAAEVGAIPISDADTFAKKEDIGTVYKYKGSKETEAELPEENNEIGDVWNVESTDMNYGWTGTEWDPLGQPFQIETLTNAEIDAIMNA